MGKEDLSPNEVIKKNRIDPKNWKCLDDGVPGGSRGYVNIVTGERSRHKPAGLEIKYWQDGTQAYHFIGRCVDCLDDCTEMPPAYPILHDTRAVCFNLCFPCISKVSQRIRLHGPFGV